MILKLSNYEITQINGGSVWGCVGWTAKTVGNMMVQYNCPILGGGLSLFGGVVCEISGDCDNNPDPNSNQNSDFEVKKNKYWWNRILG